MEKDHVAALRRAVDIVGSQVALAVSMTEFFVSTPEPRRVSQQLVSYWLNNGTLLDAVWWPAVEHVTRRKVTRQQLRPDVFGNGKAA